jgi:cellulose synthase/poly-beta-1,6-N-acetylglucosamine synthase-like glycosyltransferase
MTLLFWGCAAYVAYAYVGFPLLTILRGRLRPRPYRRAEIEPSVSLLVAAYNEAGVIEGRIRNALALDYPPERLEIVVASDTTSARMLSRSNVGFQPIAVSIFSVEGMRWSMSSIPSP